MLIDGSRIVTCAHVVEDATHSQAHAPMGPVWVDFPALGDEGRMDDPVEARVITSGGWFPVDGIGRGDIAVLELVGTAPDGCQAPPLLRPPRMRGHGFRVTGFPALRQFGVEATGVVGDAGGPGWEWIQLEQPDRASYRVAKGFSGGPVWDEQAEAVVGIVVVVDDDDDARIAFMIPIGIVEQTWAPLRGSIGWRVRFDRARDTHWDERARGTHAGAATQQFFTGRTAALRDLVAWIARPDGRARVVTGRPGSGKSAVLARLVMCADAVELPRMGITDEDRSRWTIPPIGAIDLAIVATGRPSRWIVDTIARWFDIDADTRGRSSDQVVAALVAGLRGVAERAQRVPVIVIDQLDAAHNPLEIVNQLLGVLHGAGVAHLIIGLQSQDESPVLALLARFCDELDLDERAGAAPDVGAGYLDLADLQQYIAKWLVADGPAGYREDRATALRVAGLAAHRAQPSFLVGRLVAHWLTMQKEVFDGPLERFPADVDQAMDRYIGGFAPVLHNTLRDLLSALALAEGSGLPATGPVWPATARAVSRRGYAAKDVEWVCQQAASLIVQAAEFDGRRSCRLFHDALVQSLSPPAEQQAGVQERVVAQLGSLYPPGSGDDTDPYVEQHLAAHAAKAPLHAWDWIGDRLELLDRLHPAAVRSAALRTALRQSLLPRAVVGVIQSQDLMAASGRSDRTGLRQLGMARASGRTQFSDEHSGLSATWSVRSAVIVQHPAHLPLDAGDAVNALAGFAGPGGAPILLVGCDDGAVRMWDATTGDRFGTPLRSERAIRAVAACGVNGSVCVVGAGDGALVRIWDPVSGGEPDLVDTRQPGIVRAVAAFTRDGRLCIATAADGDHEIAIWDRAGDRVATLAGQGPYRSLVATADGARIHAGSEDGAVVVWDLDGPPADGAVMAPVNVLTGPTDWVRSLCTFTAAGIAYVAAAGDDRRLRVWCPPAPNAMLDPETGHVGAVLAVAAYSSDGVHVVATTGGDAAIRLWDAVSGKPIGQPLTGHSGPVCALTAYDVATGDARIASGGQDGTLRIWNPRSAVRIGAPIAAPVLVVAVPGDGRMLTGGLDGIVRIWDPVTGTELDRFDAGVGAVRAIGPGFRKHEYAFGGDAECVRFFDVDKRVETAVPLEGHAGPVRALTTWTACDKTPMVATAGDDATVRLWDQASGVEIMAALSPRENPIRALAAFEDQGRWRLAVAGDSRTLHLRDTATRDSDEIALEGHQDWVMAVCAYPGAGGIALLASAGDDGSVRTWRPRVAEQLAVLGCHDAPVRAIAACSVDGRTRIVTGGDDATVRVWDPGTYGEPRVIRLGAKVNAVAWIEGGVVAGTDEGHVVLDLRP